ncbi:uncharacterized protein LOC126845703 isoform X2 [Adelges cooleyi]|uniref:uncharacterized protein LOC126845703 isoform X2 n=1 Tax=Adelges cooleyi TaxID=133065 RepID=UPI00217F888D|nr:uncharacterized protein LOC126845703 isoform X2 [Adelges cooleyi]
MAELDSVISEIRACVISNAGKSQSGIPLQQIDKDYFGLVGQRIPYRKLGFSSLEALFQSSNQFHLEHRGGTLWVNMVNNDKTQHLTDLIKKQKSKPPKKKKMVTQPFNHFSPQNKPNYQNRNYQYPKNGHNTNYKPLSGFNAKYNNTYKTSQSSFNNNKVGYHNTYQPRPQDGANFKKMHQNYNGTKNINVNTKPAIPFSNNRLPVNANSNGQLNNKTDQVPLPPLTSSCSSLESTYSTHSVGHTVASTVPKSQANTFSRQPIVDKPENTYNPNLQKKPPPTSATLITSLLAKQNLVVKPSTAQSRLQKYPKKCEETANKDDTKEIPQTIQSNGVQLDNFTSQAVGNDIKVNNTFQAKRIQAAEQVISAAVLDNNADYPVTDDINVMASRVKDLLKSDNQKSGVPSDDLEQKYRENYKENLLENWVEYLAVFKYFTCENVVPNKMVIYLNEQPATNLSNGHNGEINGTHQISNEPSADEDTTDVPGTALFLNDYEEKSVLVTAIYSSLCVYVRYVDEDIDESFIEMDAKFNTQMNSNYCLVEDIIEGEFYAVLYESSWHRVQAASISEVDVDCYMIDTGETLTVSKDQICFIDPIFLKTKAQGIQCGLTQLENFSAFFGLKDILDEVLLNKKFVLVPDNLEDPTLPTVTLYETTDDMTNVNDLIVQKFIEKSITKLPLFEDNEVVNGTVSSVVASGHLYLQLNSDVVASLEEILPTDCDGYYPEYFVKSKAEIDLKKIYLAKYELDNIWSRVQVTEFIDENEVNIIYIDYGNNGKSEIAKLLDLEKYDPLMTKIPPQAIKVTMNLLPPSIMTSEIANEIYKMVGSEKVLVNLVNAPANEVPCIQLYKTQPEDDTPICLNIKLAKSIKKQ